MAAIEASTPGFGGVGEHHLLTPTPRRTVELGGTPLPI